jgi:hypothetical protein
MSRRDLDYERLKELAESLGRPFASVFVLSGRNDPFMADMPSRRAAAMWFADIWERLKLTPGMHDRRIHYLIISQQTPVLDVNGEAYENTEACWKRLTYAIRDARYLELIPASAIVDRRSPDPAIFRTYGKGEDEEGEDSEAHIYPSAGGTGSATVEISGPELWLPSLKLSKPTISQPYHLEIFCEKSTINDVLMPLGEQYRINIILGIGETSATACEALVERARESGRPVRVLYVSDFDPAGQSMPLAAARKIEFYGRSVEGLDIQVRPVALTHDQCVRYRLPRTPIKDSEVRGARFEARFGEGATELDAMEAVRPGELRRILVREIERYHDGTLDHRIRAAANEVAGEIVAITRQIHGRHADAIAALEAEQATISAEVERMRERVAAMESEFDERARPILAAIAQELRDAAPDADDYEWPEPEDADEDDDPLFDSTRDYVEQVERYREHQGKEAEPTVWTKRKLSLTCVMCGGAFTATQRTAKTCGDACKSQLWRDRDRKRSRTRKRHGKGWTT